MRVKSLAQEHKTMTRLGLEPRPLDPEHEVQGRVVRKPISANPGLKVNREFNFFCIKVFLLFMFCED